MTDRQIEYRASAREYRKDLRDRAAAYREVRASLETEYRDQVRSLLDGIVADMIGGRTR